jgi:hypothetical protein
MSLQLNTTLPNLFVSQTQLNFAPTDVGDERFAVVRIGQEGSDVPVRVVSEVAQFFQVAVQASPLRFGAEATFTPAPGGTFIHIRYAPKQAGRHAGELTIEADQGTQTIGLSGRTTGLLARLSPQTSPAPLPAPRQKALPAPNPDYAPVDMVEQSSPRRPLLTIAVVVGLIGGSTLAYWGVTHPNKFRQLLSATKKELANVVPTAEKATPPGQLTKAPVAISPKVESVKPSTTLVRKRSRRTDQKPKAAAPLNEPPTPAERNVTERNEPAKPAQAQTRTAQVQVRAEQPQQVRTEQPQQARTEPPKKKPAPAKPKPAETPTAESDLERELNKNQ